MAFNPDAYLAGNSGRFDPDAYLAGQSSPEFSLRKYRVGELAIPEAIANIGTGLGASAVAGFRGAGSLLSGDSLDEAARKIEETQNKYTYQPRSSEGKTLAHIAALPVEYATKGAQYALGGVGELVNGQEGRNVGELIGGIGVPAIATILGGRAAIAKAPALADAAQAAFERAKTAKQEKLGQTIADGVIESGNIAPRLDAMKVADKHGVTLDPVSANPSTLNSVLEASADQSLIRNKAANRNIPIANNIAKKELGVDNGVALTPEVFDAVRAEKAKAYEDLRNLPEFPVDATYTKDIGSINRLEGMTEQGKAALKDPKIEELQAKVNQGSWNGNDIVTLMQEYRKIGNDALNKQGVQGAVTPAIGRAYKDAAKALENLVDRHLTRLDEANPNAGFGDVAANFKDARTVIAKAHTLQKATSLEGNVNPVALAAEAEKSRSFTGGVQELAQLGSSFPEVFTKSNASHAPARLTRSGVGGALGFAAGSLVGAPFEGAAAGAALGIPSGMLLRSKILSREYQKKHARLPDFRTPEFEPVKTAQLPPLNPVEQSGNLPDIGGSPLIPGSWRSGMSQSSKLSDLPVFPEDLLPMVDRYTGTDIPIGRIEGGLFDTPKTLFPQIPPQGRGLLSIDDSPQSGGTQPAWQKGGGVDFPLRQEVLQSLEPEISAFRHEQARLSDLIDKSGGFWKNRYRKELDALQTEFAAGMRQLGVDNAGEAHGLNRRQYQRGEGTKLPIQKSKSLKDLMQ